jgi:hypothetical protein
VHDALKMEAHGTPATVVITEPFQGLVASSAVKLGAPGYHALVLPHPVWGRSPEQLRRLVRGIADQALRHLLPE